MGAAQHYHRMALECLELAEAARDAASQDVLIHMAELWAKLADRAEANAASRRPDDPRGADAAA
jgi:hypothetical protein